MKLSELLMYLLYSKFYTPGSNVAPGHSYMCNAAHKWAVDNNDRHPDDMKLYLQLQSQIESRLGQWDTLENYLHNEKGIARKDYAPRYEWFFNLALELENLGL